MTLKALVRNLSLWRKTCRPWIVTGSACQHPAYVLWYKQPPERRGPSPEVWKTLAEEQELQSLFAGLVDGGAPGNVGVRIWGTKPNGI